MSDSLSRRRFATAVGGALVAVAAAPTISRAAAAANAAAASGTPAATTATDAYTQQFLTQYNKIKNSANGYFSAAGVPYHSVETLIVEAPDYGHQTTSEAFSFWMWLEATYGRVTGDWTPFNNAWTTAEHYIIPSHTDQPSNSSYNPSSPATYAPEWPSPSDYPSALNTSVPVGQDPLANELTSTYGTADVYGMHWLLDVDNTYGYGNTPGTGGEAGPTAAGPSYINSYQRGSAESVWLTVPQPCTDLFTYGGPNGYLDLFVAQTSAYSKQYKYTDAPDADSRAIQAAYWAYRWASAQGAEGQIAASVAKAAKMGDYLRYAFFDKYFKQIGDCTDASSCAAGTGRSSEHYLLSWYYAWGGGEPGAGWAWRIGDGASHQGYQNPLAAWALSTVATMTPQSPTAQSDWSGSLARQLEFYQWLQTAEGAMAGGCTNSWEGQYATPPAGTSTFYGMAYDWEPVYHDPPSNNWFGFQAWSMERVAEYYYVTGDARARALLDKWVAWAISETTVTATNFQIPSTLGWSGQPDTWNPAAPGSNSGLHVSVVDYGNDVGVAAGYAKTLTYYSAKSGDATSGALAKSLLDVMATFADTIGISVPETRADYSSFGATVYVPTGWSGKMPNGDAIVPGATFTSIRSWYKSDPSWSQVETYLNGGAAPVFSYHRFWAQADIAMAYAVYGELFEGSGTGPTATPPTVPTGLAASNVTSTSVTLSWTASTDPSSSVAGYTVYRGSTKVGLTTGTSYTDTGLTAATTYAYTVTAQDPTGDTSAASTALSVTTSAAPAGGGCTAVYSVSSDWGTGFNGNVTITNNGTTATRTWQVSWTWPGNQTITNVWNASCTQTGTSVTAGDLAYNNAIAPGASTSFGFGATYTGGNTAPTVTVTST